MAKKDKEAAANVAAAVATAEPPVGDAHLVEQSTAKSARDVVTVASKLPNGLYLQLFEMKEVQEITPLGVRSEQKAIKLGMPIRVNGAASPFGAPPRHLVIGGYALTPNVPKDHWDRWAAANADSDVVRNRIVFAFESRDEIESEAKKHESVRTGFEPVDPSKPMPGLRNPQGVTVEPFNPKN